MTARTRIQSQQAVRLVWFLTAIGIGSGVAVLAMVALPWNQLGANEERATQLRTITTQSIADTDAYLKSAEADLQLLLDDTTEASANPLWVAPMQKSLERLHQLIGQSEATETAAALLTDSEDSSISLQKIRERSLQWHIESQQVNTRLQKVHKDTQATLQQMSALASSAEGLQRLKLADQVRSIRSSQEPSGKGAVEDLILSLVPDTVFAEINLEINDLLLITEQLYSEKRPDYLISKKDNQLSLSFSRLNYLLHNSQLQNPGFQAALATKVGTLADNLFGPDHAFDPAHQTIHSGTQGLYYLCTQRLLLDKANAALHAEVLSAFDNAYRTRQQLSQITNDQVISAANSVRSSLSRAWMQILAMGIGCWLVFLVLAKRIARVLRQQFRSIEEQNADLQTQNRERAEAGERLEQINHCFLHFGSDTGENIRQLTSLAGKILNADVACYSRRERSVMKVISQWNSTENFQPIDAESSLCTDVLKLKREELVVFPDLTQTAYAQADANVQMGPFASYVGKSIRIDAGSEALISLFFRRPVAPGDQETKLITLITAALRVEEEKRKAQAGLEAERHLMNMLMNNVPDYIYFKGLEGNFLRVNQMMARSFSMEDPSEALGTTDAHFYDEAYARQTAEQEQKIILTGESLLHREERQIWNDGRESWAISTKMPLHNPEGETIGTFGISQDITERKHAEAKMALLATALSSIEEGILITELSAARRSLKIVVANAGVTRITGYSMEELIGQTPQLFFGPKTNRKTLELLEQSVAEGKSFTEELVNYRKDGSEFFVEVHMSPVPDPDGKVTHFIAHLRDVTNRKKSDVLAAQSQKMESIGHLAAGVAHEINSPMQFIATNTEFLKDSFVDLCELVAEYQTLKISVQARSEYAAECAALQAAERKVDIEYLVDEIPRAIDQSLEGITRVTRLVSAMKNFSHPGASEKRASNLNEGIEATATISRNEWKYVSELVTEVDPALPPVHCNVDEINQVILNMIVNSSHAIKDALDQKTIAKGFIRIKTARNNGHAVITIEDNGAGMPQEIIEKIYDPFFTTKSVGKGTGQGLAITHDIIVNKHRGYIDVESQLGKGARFTIGLPILAP